ncbi:MAG: hypothetical protein ACT4O0_11175 [Pseudonocardia sp.]
MNSTLNTALTGEAVTYQRLRAHLAFLKLPAAAEALPGILDLAREEQLTAIDTLERVLAVEVDTTHARRLASRLRFACLPTTRLARGVRLHRPTRSR